MTSLIERLPAPLEAPASGGLRLGTVEKVDGSRVLRVRDYVPGKGGFVPAPGGLLMERRGVGKDKLDGLPDGAPEFNGGVRFAYATMAEQVPGARVVALERVAKADSVKAVFDAFFGWDV